MSDAQTLPEFFLFRYHQATPEKRADAIRTAIANGHGNWLSPFDGDAALRHPPTHLHEISLFGVTATGDTADRAVANWFTVAARVLTDDSGPQVAA